MGLHNDPQSIAERVFRAVLFEIKPPGSKDQASSFIKEMFEHCVRKRKEELYAEKILIIDNRIMEAIVKEVQKRVKRGLTYSQAFIEALLENDSYAAAFEEAFFGIWQALQRFRGDTFELSIQHGLRTFRIPCERVPRLKGMPNLFIPSYHQSCAAISCKTSSRERAAGEVAREAEGARKRLGVDFPIFYISLEEPIPPSTSEYLEGREITCYTISDFPLLLRVLDNILKEARIRLEDFQ